MLGEHHRRIDITATNELKAVNTFSLANELLTRRVAPIATLCRATDRGPPRSVLRKRS